MQIVGRSLNRPATAGSALLSALCVVTVVALLSTAYLELAIRKHREGTASADDKRAFYIAESGFAESLMGLVKGKSGNVGSDVVPAQFADGVFWVTTEDAGDGKLMLRSTGLCGTGRAALSIVVEKSVHSVASLGLFAGDEMTVEQGCTVDSYDSRVGQYEAQDPGVAAKIGCNMGISLHGAMLAPTVVNGDATPGPEMSVVRDNNVKITGTTAPLDEKVDLPAIAPPSFARETSIVRSKKGAFTIPSGEYGLQVLQLKNGVDASLQGPATLVVEALRIDKGANLSIDASQGPVMMYVLDELDAASGSGLTTSSKTPSGVALLAAPKQVTLRSKGKFHGTIYAPNASLELPKSFEVFGAVTARSVTLQAGARLHFDNALSAVSGDEGGLPRMSCWRIVDLPDVELVRVRMDPLRALELAGVHPIPSKSAHYDVGQVPPSNDPNVVAYTGGLPGCSVPGGQAPPPPPPPVSPQAAALIARIDFQPPLGSSQLRDELIAASPLDPPVLRQAIDRIPEMNDSHLRDVLVQNAPLDVDVLTSLLNRATALASSDLKDVLIASSPLDGTVLTKVLATLPPPLSPSDLIAVLSKQ